MKNFGLPLERYNDKLDVMVRPYLTYNDVIDIAETALRCDNVMEQEICVALNSIEACCKDINVEELDIDEILWGGIWDEIRPMIENVNLVWEYIERKDNASVAISNFFNNTLVDFMDNLEKNMDKYVKHMPKQKDWEKIVEEMPKSLSEVMALVKEDGNADIIRNAIKMGEK
jgi:hypothetical protein